MLHTRKPVDPTSVALVRTRKSSRHEGASTQYSGKRKRSSNDSILANEKGYDFHDDWWPAIALGCSRGADVTGLAAHLAPRGCEHQHPH